MSSKNNVIMRTAIDCVRVAEQLADIATDWNLDEVEIDGKMVRTHDLARKFRRCLNMAINAGIPIGPAAPPAGECAK